MPNQTFQNPYALTPKSNLARLQSMVDKDDYKFPQSLRLKHGTVTTVVNILFKKLVEESKRRGFEDVTNCEDFEHFVANCAIVLPNEVDMLAYNGIARQPQPIKKGKKNG